MRDFVIMTDSCCDLPADLAQELGLQVLPLSLTIGKDNYRNYLDGRDIGFPQFYDRVRQGAMPVTSAISVGDVEAAMRPVLQEGKDILCISFSSVLSATHQSSRIAAEALRQEFPEAAIYTLDSRSASLGQGLLLYLCARQKQAGKTLEQVRAYAEETIHQICHWFTVDDLNHLKRGGRVSGATALLGTMLSIKPVMHVDDEGRLTPVSKSRGRKASLLALVDEMEKSAINPKEQTVFISHGDCLADAQFVADEITRRFGTQDIRIHYVGPVIGSHTGAGVVALFFLGSKR